MIKKIEHIGIAVKNLDEAEKLFTLLLGRPPYKREKVESEGVEVSFFRMGETKIELLASLAPGSAIARFIAKRGEGLHHIAFDTDDVEAELQRLADQGFELIHHRPKEGADGKWIAFVHPRSAAGVLTELCQDKPGRS